MYQMWAVAGIHINPGPSILPIAITHHVVATRPSRTQGGRQYLQSPSSLYSNATILERPAARQTGTGGLTRTAVDQMLAVAGDITTPKHCT